MKGWFCAFWIVLGAAARLGADNGWEGRILSLTEENDVTDGTDRHYTQGARISYWSGDDDLPGWLQRFSSWLPGAGMDVQGGKFGFLIGQDIYTPEDLKTAQLISTDRPYAGWLFVNVSLQRRGEMSPTWLALETIGVELGVVGPESGAEAAQVATHSFKPRGWRNQLTTEVGFDLKYERR